MEQSGGGFWLYLRIVALNVATAVMIFTISQTVPPPATLHASNLINVISKQQIQNTKSGIPTQIVIPSLGIDLAVGVGSYNPNDENWTIDASQAYYADTSVPINDHNGTTLIYGHAQQPVFGNLQNILPDSEAIVSTDTGYKFHYRYVSMQQVLPTDTSVFQDTGEPKLVLQTCTGAWDSYRALFTFHLESVNKI